MTVSGDGRLTRRALVGAIVVGLVAMAGAAGAQDVATALRDVAASPDFRVRLSAALVLGRLKPAGAREALDRAASDVHPAVRVAAVMALGALGDPSAVAALTRRLAVEPSASVRAQIQTTIDQLRHAVAPDAPAAGAGALPIAGNVRYVVRLGAMRNPTGVRGDELRRVLNDAARSRARLLKGAAVVEDAAGLAQAAQRHLPVITLDGSLRQLVESRVEGNVQVQARVEFAVRRDQVLKGTISGAATTFGAGPSVTEQARRRLQDDAVDGAVQSALRGAESGLIAAL